MSKPYVSIIIPAHNEALTLQETVIRIIHYCEHDLPGRYEVLVVENGSHDATYAKAVELQSTYRPVRAFAILERSKAAAVRYGMTMAQGEYRYMCDADLSTPINELRHFLRLMQTGGWDVVIASREHRDSSVQTSFTRYFIGRVFQALVQQVTGVSFADTQCGFKLFTARAANDIFFHARCTSMAFDVELLYLADKLGYYVTDMPVTWQNNPDSRVRLIRDSWLMLRDVLRIKTIHADVMPEYKKKVPA